MVSMCHETLSGRKVPGADFQKYVRSIHWHPVRSAHRIFIVRNRASGEFENDRESKKQEG